MLEKIITHLFFYYTGELIDKKRKILSYQYTFLHKIEIYLKYKKLSNKIILYKEINLSFNKITIFLLKDNEILKLKGYFQSSKYFSKYRDTILELFQPKTQEQYYIKNKYKDLLEKKNLTFYMFEELYYLTKKIMNVMEPVLLDFYNKAIEYLKNKLNDNITYLVFSDDINWCKENFNNKKFVFIDSEESSNDYLELYLMSLCNNFIIPNSSFSWWGLLFIKKIVIKLLFHQNYGLKIKRMK